MRLNGAGRDSREVEAEMDGQGAREGRAGKEDAAVGE